MSTKKLALSVVAATVFVSSSIIAAPPRPGGTSTTQQRPGLRLNPCLTSPKTDVTILIQKASCNSNGFSIKVRAQNTTNNPTIPTCKTLKAPVYYIKGGSSSEQLIPMPPGYNPHTVPILTGGHTWHVNGYKPGAGKYKIVAYVDKPNSLAETDETNNRKESGWFSCP